MVPGHMKVTDPMIQRGAQALRDARVGDYHTFEGCAETVLRAALNDPKDAPKPIDGQMTVDDFPEAFVREEAEASVKLDGETWALEGTE